MDGVIHRAGGKAIFDDCKILLRGREDALLGKRLSLFAGNLFSKYVINAEGPVWNGGNKTRDSDVCFDDENFRI